MRNSLAVRFTTLIFAFTFSVSLISPAQAAPKKTCSSKQEITLLDLDRRTFSLNRILRDQSQSIEVNQELLSAAVATNNQIDSSRIGSKLTILKQNLQSTERTLSQISTQKNKILSTCKLKSRQNSSQNSASGSTLTKCSPTQLDLIQLLAQQHESTLKQIQEKEIEIYRQRNLAKTFISRGRSTDVAKANFEIQRLSSQASDLAGYGSIVKRQFEVANSSCSDSNVKLSELLTETFVPNSLIAMNINRFESVTKELTRPIINASSGNLSLACDESASDFSPYPTVGIYFAFTTKKPEIWDRYNGAGVDSDAFTKIEFQPTYLKQPDSTFSFQGFNGGSFTFKAFKADIKKGVTRHICDYEIVPVVPSQYTTDAVGIWYFVIAQSGNRTTIWSLSGFTLQNYLNPTRW